MHQKYRNEQICATELQTQIVVEINRHKPDKNRNKQFGAYKEQCLWWKEWTCINCVTAEGELDSTRIWSNE